MGGEDAAAELRSVGTPAEFEFLPADHLALGGSLGLLDFDAGASPSQAVWLKCDQACTILPAHDMALETALRQLACFCEHNIVMHCVIMRKQMCLYSCKPGIYVIAPSPRSLE